MIHRPGMGLYPADDDPADHHKKSAEPFSPSAEDEALLEIEDGIYASPLQRAIRMSMHRVRQGRSDDVVTLVAVCGRLEKDFPGIAKKATVQEVKRAMDEVFEDCWWAETLAMGV